MRRAHVNAAEYAHAPVHGVYARDRHDLSVRHLCELRDGYLFGGLISEVYGEGSQRSAHGFSVEDCEEIIIVEKTPAWVHHEPFDRDWGAVIDDHNWARAQDYRGA